jgi:hypothetical protein
MEAEIDADAEAEAELDAEVDTEADSEIDAEAEDTELVEVDESSPVIQLPANMARAPRVHIHLETKVHGGPNSDNMERVEERFDGLHDRIMGRLNKLMSRINRHPDSVEDKTAAYGFRKLKKE